MKEEEKKIEKTNTTNQVIGVQCNYASVPSWCSVSSQAAAVPTQPNPPKFYGTVPRGVEYPFGQSEQAALAVLLQLKGSAERGTEKALTVQALLCSNESISVLSVLFSS